MKLLDTGFQKNFQLAFMGQAKKERQSGKMADGQRRVLPALGREKRPLFLQSPPNPFLTKDLQSTFPASGQEAAEIEASHVQNKLHR